MDGGKSPMRTERVDEVLLQDYLLGELSEEEQARVEDRAFADGSYRAALEAVEADLIEYYGRGEVAAADRRKFEERFLRSPQRRNRVEFARALARVVAESGPEMAPGRLSTWQSLLNLLRTAPPVPRFAAGMVAL